MMTRVVDLILAAAALVVLSPVLLFIAVAIVLDSKGGPLYLAPRVGKGGAEFRMLKFRTMVPGAARLGSAITGRNDRRVTRLGRFLRRTKLDELPQLANVFLGHMTFVGPRPETPEIVAMYTPEQRAVLRVKPGLTGCAQLAAGCEEDQIPDGVDAGEYYVRHLLGAKLERDLEYVSTRTRSRDARIVFSTACYVLRSLVHRGA